MDRRDGYNNPIPVRAVPGCGLLRVEQNEDSKSDDYGSNGVPLFHR
jgi:hypothetical protein